MKLRLLGVLMLGICACGSQSDDESGSGSGVLPNLGAPAITGAVNGIPWNFVSGRAEKQSDGKLVFSLFSATAGLPCYYQNDLKTNPQVTFVLPGAVGVYPLTDAIGSDKANGAVLVNMVYHQSDDKPPMNYLTGSGAIALDSLTTNTATGRLTAGDKDTHKISGSFTVEVCGDIKLDRIDVSGEWLFEDLKKSAGLYLSPQGSYGLLVPYHYDGQLRGAFYRYDSDHFTTTHEEDFFAYIKSAHVLLGESWQSGQSMYAKKQSIWKPVGSCEGVSGAMLAACNLLKEVMQLASAEAPIPTLSLQSGYGFDQHNEKLTELSALVAILAANPANYHSFASQHKLKFLVVANTAAEHEGFYLEDATFDINTASGHTAAALRTLLGIVR